MKTETHDKRDTRRKYDFQEVESRWQEYWTENKLFAAPETLAPGDEKYYMLEMFAYPSGDIHMGHFRNYIIGDAVARRQMMLGKKVLHPFGWDAFGLPAERAAIQRKLQPKDWTEKNIRVSRETLQKVGISYDWSREIVTCREDYYRWSQWLFLKLFERGLAYRKQGFVNWCPGCLTVLANEQVVQGLCERCDSQVVKKEQEQWYFKITEYADRLYDDLDKLSGWPNNVKTMQKEWIGRSFGAEVTFDVADSDTKITVYTTRLDTIFGVTFITLAPESPLVKQLSIPQERRAGVEKYIEQAMLKSEIERGADNDDKTGVFTGCYAINPFNGEKAPIWVADYVLAHYGTGAVMGVPANDTRDRAFAKKYDLPIRQILKTADGSEVAEGEVIPIDNGVMINSGEYDGLSSAEGIEKLAQKAERDGFGRKAKQFKLHDWLISRQRYWGTPIPVVHCGKCGVVPVPEDELPVVLPPVEDFMPKGRSPLEDVEEFMSAICGKCGGPARRDPDTMDTFICSSWYHLRYADPHNNERIFDSDKVNSWLPVDKYIGGVTHATGHLLYFRFITKFLYDIGLVGFEEPAVELFNHGMVKDATGAVMSKSRGNVVSPIDLMKERGVDVSRLAMYFTAPSEKEVLWSDAAVVGVEKFLVNKIARLAEYADGERPDLKRYFKKDDLDGPGWELYVCFNQTLARMNDDYERLQFNTVISGAMELVRELERSATSNTDLKPLIAARLVQTLAPLTPHVCEEMWSQMGFTESVFRSEWPSVDENALTGNTISIAVQVNGKLRDNIQIDPSADKERVLELARSSERVRGHTDGKTVIKEIYVPGKIVNLVVK